MKKKKINKPKKVRFSTKTKDRILGSIKKFIAKQKQLKTEETLSFDMQEEVANLNNEFIDYTLYEIMIDRLSNSPKIDRDFNNELRKIIDYYNSNKIKLKHTIYQSYH